MRGPGISSDEEGRAINDVMSVLPISHRDTTQTAKRWHPSIFLEVNGRLKSVMGTNIKSDKGHRRAAQSLYAQWASQRKDPVCMGQTNRFLVARVAPSALSRAPFFAVLSEAEMADFLTDAFPDVHLPPALQRVLTLHMAGVGLKEGASIDFRSVDTRKRQSQQLRAAFGMDDLATIGRTVSNTLAVALDRHVHPHSSIIGKSVAAYVGRYMPKSSRLHALSDQDGNTVKIVDMGPLDGAPMLVLHPMALPDIRQPDIDLMERLGLRLIWPLRHGVCEPDARPLPHDKHLAHAINSASMALDIMCRGQARVLAFAAASRLGVDLAHARPDAVQSLHVAGVCVREDRPESGPRRLALGVLRLAASNPKLLDPILGHLETQLRKPGAFKAFLKQQFADSKADSAIIDAELHGPFGINRFRDALLDSAASARHDFLFQQDLGWDRVPAGLPLHLHHGTQDRIHPMPLIEALAAKLPNATLHKHSGVGQLFCHQHFTPLLTTMARTIQDNGRS